MKRRVLLLLSLLAALQLPVGDLGCACAMAADVQPEGRDSAAISAAIQRCQAGDILRLPADTYLLSASIRMKSGVRLVGAGQGKTTLNYSGDTPAPFISVVDCEDVEIAHLTLDGQDNPLVRDGMIGGNSRRLFIRHVTFCNLGKGSSSFSHGIMFSGHNPTMERGVTDSTISDCRFERIGLTAKYGGAIRMAWGSMRNQVERNVIRDTGRGGIFGDHSAELVIRNNQVSGSGGEGLGIEIWGGCPRSLIEENLVDHWISVDQGNQSAVRRNVVGTDDGTLKGYGIEIIASDVVVTDNVIKRGASIGLSVSNQPRKNNVFWGYNTIRDCVQWGAQLQGETGGIAQHYFYRCSFEKTIRGDARARYPQDSGHGFRFNGFSRELVFEECTFGDNGGLGVQILGPKVDAIAFLSCVFTNNRQGLITGLTPEMTADFKACQLAGHTGPLPAAKSFLGPAPEADFGMPPVVQAGAAAQFECKSKTEKGAIAQHLWDFGHGIPEVVADLEGKDYNNGKGTLQMVMRDPAKAARFKHLKDEQGQWAVRDDVWVRYQPETGPVKAGPLSLGFTPYSDKHHFGPELQFGHVMGDHFDNQVLLIKTAWGGKSLYKDFRPPSSGGAVGPYYTKMLAEVRAALANLKMDFPACDGGGYELAGFVWYHGWNDGCEPKTAVPEYEQNLVNLIKDVRKELNAPNLPVVVGELTGPWVQAPGEWATLRQAQAAAAARPEFQGNAIFVETHDFVRPPAWFSDDPRPPSLAQPPGSQTHRQRAQESGHGLGLRSGLGPLRRFECDSQTLLPGRV